MPARWPPATTLRTSGSCGPGWPCCWPTSPSSLPGRPRGGWACMSSGYASGANVGPSRGSRWMINPGRAGPGVFPPEQQALAKAIACELPARRGLPLSPLSVDKIGQELIDQGAVSSLSRSTVWRWLHQDALRPWYHRFWQVCKDPDFLPKAQRVLELYQGRWEGRRLGRKDHVICADEKTGLQILERIAPTRPPQPGQVMRVEHEYRRRSTACYLAGLDVRTGQVTGRLEARNGKASFMALLDQVMAQPPYRSARRVFLVVDNGGARHPASLAERVRRACPNVVVVHLPKYASWLNQIELYFSIYHRKVLTPNDCPDRATLAERTRAFEARYNRRARPFQRQFTVHQLRQMMKRVEQRPYTRF